MIFFYDGLCYTPKLLSLLRTPDHYRVKDQIVAAAVMALAATTDLMKEIPQLMLIFFGSVYLLYFLF